MTTPTSFVCVWFGLETALLVAGSRCRDNNTMSTIYVPSVCISVQISVHATSIEGGKVLA